MGHPYIAFRTRLAHFALLQFAASLKSSSEILLFAFAPVLLGLLAMVALPPMYAVTLPPADALALLGAHVVLMSAPVWLLRKRLLPRDVLQWLHPLPIAPRTQWLANLAVAGIVVGPLALLTAVSAAVWLYQAPAWLRPVLGCAAAVGALALSWAGSAAILALRARAPRPARAQRPRPASTVPRHYAIAAHARQPSLTGLFLWHRLYWLPFWRMDSMVGLQQCLLLLAAIACALAWMLPVFDLPRALLGAGTSAMLMLLTDRGDKAVREQAARLRPVMAGWPGQRHMLERCARLFTLLPGALVLALLFLAGLVHGAWTHRAALVYLGVATASQLLIVGIPKLSARARVSLLVLSIAVLTAVGSEIWN